MRTFDQFVEHLAVRIGFSPSLVIDVGVAWGTPSLYAHFPKAHLILIEALPYFERYLKDILKSRSGEYILCGVSDSPHTRTVKVKGDEMSLAGINVIDGGLAGELEYEISLDTLDRLLENHRMPQPALLKLDVQGADYRALQGGVQTLKKCEVVIVEASLLDPKNLVADIIAFMLRHDFELYDVFGSLNRPYDNALGQLDLAFVAKRSPVFRYKGWA